MDIDAAEDESDGIDDVASDAFPDKLFEDVEDTQRFRKQPKMDLAAGAMEAVASTDAAAASLACKKV